IEIGGVFGAPPSAPIDTLVFIDSTNHIANNYPGQLCSLSANSIWYTSQFQGYFNNAGGFYTTEKPSVTLISAGKLGETISDSCQTNLKGITMVEYDAGLGLTYYNIFEFEYNATWNLVAYRKGNDTVGTFTPDSDFYTAVTPSQSDKNILVYPNPANNYINIALKDAQQSTITLNNLQGQLIKKENTNSNLTTIDISGLPSGMYLLSITTETGTEYTKVVKQ